MEIEVSNDVVAWQTSSAWTTTASLQNTAVTSDDEGASEVSTLGSALAVAKGKILPSDFIQPGIGLIILAVNLRLVYTLYKQRQPNVQVAFMYLVNIALSDVVS